MDKTPKQLEYAQKILEKVAKLFEEEIDQKELREGDNLTHFLHAFANIAPRIFYNNVTGEKKDILEFNHIANTLVFLYGKKK